MTGLVLCGFGFGAFVFNLISTAVVNPHGIDAVGGFYPPEVYENFPKMMRVLVIIWAGITVISIFLFFPYVEDPYAKKVE